MFILCLGASTILSCRHAAVPKEGIALLVDPIDTTITLGAWRAAHPTDSVPFDSLISTRDPFLCRHARTTLTIAGVRMQRIATFEVPNEPPEFGPIDDTTGFAERNCHLSGVALRYENADSLRVAAIADSVTRIYRAASHDSVKIVDVYPAIDSVNEETLKHTTHAHLMLASKAVSRAITGDVVDFTGDNAVGHDAQIADLVNRRISDSALALVSVPAIAADIRSVNDYAIPRLNGNTSLRDSLRTPSYDSLVARIFKRVGDTAAQLPPTPRAALLLASDLAITRYAGWLSDQPADAKDQRTYALLAAAGIPYEDSHLGSEYVYTRKWFYDAYSADSAGPIGRMLIVPLLAQGWNASASCMHTGGSFGASAAIEHGEAALAGGATDPLIHFLLGEAYMDDVALSQGALEDYADAKDFREAAKTSRPKAIAHFLAALRGLRDKELQRRAWIYAMRLMVGARTTTTFTCIYD